MEQVIHNRTSGNAWVSLPTPLPAVDGYVAVPDCSRLGKLVYLRYSGPWETFLVADCAMPKGTDGAYEWMTENGIGVEVDYETAVRWGIVGRGARVEIGRITDTFPLFYPAGNGGENNASD
ncbi:MAG: hypothetical protein KKH61_19900 [Gammaproteobacteria bacterium]|nr:hypothetical protein [Gammaproteobacteria bacterium]